MNLVSLPTWRSVFTVATWPVEVGRTRSRRDFLITDSHGNTIAEAAAVYVLFDLNSKRPALIPKTITEAYGALPDVFRDLPMEALPDFEPSVPFSDIQVTPGDIDANGHVNNVRYLIWMLDALPQRRQHLHSRRLGPH
ncbi:MAG: thioesterase [Candidatus Latescibacteria bacterium]|nr:thioesterase [Candidatus Latescibacterota bacterium]